MLTEVVVDQEAGFTRGICEAYIARGDARQQKGKMEEAIQDYHAALWLARWYEEDHCPEEAHDKVVEAIDKFANFFEPPAVESRPKVDLKPGILVLAEGCILERFVLGAECRQQAIDFANEVSSSHEWLADLFNHYRVIRDNYVIRVYEYDGTQLTKLYSVPLIPKDEILDGETE